MPSGASLPRGARRGYISRCPEVTQQEFLDVCDYRLLPDSGNSYAVSAITGAWRDFQDILSLVFSAFAAGGPRSTAKVSQDIIERTQLNFGYAYSGSLGVVLTIQADRLLLEKTNLDRSIAAVFEMLNVRSSDAIIEVKNNYGTPVVRKLHSLAKVHSQFGLGADIKWTRSKDIVAEVITQPAEFAEICRIIEDKSDTTSEQLALFGKLLAWNTKTKTFVFEIDSGELVSGRWADEIDGDYQRKVPAFYRAELTKMTTIRYAEERDLIVWRLHSLAELGSYGN